MTEEYVIAFQEGDLLYLDAEFVKQFTFMEYDLLEEESSYMRDYIQDENNHVIGVGFDRVKIK